MRNFLQNTLFCLLFLLMINNVSSQGVSILNNDFSYSQTFSFDQSHDMDCFHGNFIIQEIAKSSQKRPDYTKFNISYMLSQKIEKIDSMHYKVILELKNFKANGDVFYRGINAEKVLIPNEMDYSICVKRKVSKPGETADVIVNRRFDNVKLRGNLGYFNILDLPFSDTLSNCQYSLSFENPKMFFNENGKNIFIQFVSTVNNYYACDEVFRELDEKLSHINVNNIDMLSFYDVEMKEIERDIDLMEAAQYPLNIGLHNNDPINYVGKMNRLKQSVIQVRTALNQKLSVLDMLFYQRGNDFLADGEYVKAENYYQKSLKVNPYYAPSQYQLARMSYNAGNIDTAAEMVNTALLKMNPDPATQQILIDLGRSIYSSLLSDGNLKNSKQLYSDAILVFEKAKWFCNSTTGITCSEELFKSLAEARYGIYYSYLLVAEKALQNKRLDIAGNYINRSLDYQKEYASEIITNSESMNLMNKLNTAYCNDGFALNGNKKFEEAIVQFNKIDSLLKIYPTLTPVSKLDLGFRTARKGIYMSILDKSEKYLSSDNLELAEQFCNDAFDYQAQYSNYISDNENAKSLMNRIKNQYYVKHIANGKRFLTVSENNSALENFMNAKKLEENYSFRKYDSLSYYIRISAKPIIMSNLKNGQMQVWGNKLPEARESYKKCSEDIIVYGLDKDSELSTELSSLKSKIFNQECANAESDYNNKIEKAKAEVKKNSYILAGNYYQQALKITADNILCDINNSFATNEKNRILPAIGFQQLIIDANNLSKQINYRESLNKFNEAKDFFSKNQIDTFGLVCPTVEEFVKGNSDVNFVYFCSDYFCNEKNYDLAFNIFTELKKRNYPVKYTKSLQVMLGSKMAVHDKINSPTADYNINILRYTEGEKYFSNFSKAYKKTWKKY